MAISHQHKLPLGPPLWSTSRQGPEWLSETGLSVVQSSSSCKGQDVHVSIDGKIARVGLPSNHRSHYTWGCACGLCKHTVALLSGFKVQPSHYVSYLLGIRQNKCSLMRVGLHLSCTLYLIKVQSV